MDLSKYKLEEETEQHWKVKGPKGSFRIAKGGLGKKTREQLAQHFAEGGEAQPLTGDAVTDAMVAGRAPVVGANYFTGDPAVDQAIASASPTSFPSADLNTVPATSSQGAEGGPTGAPSAPPSAGAEYPAALAAPPEVAGESDPSLAYGLASFRPVPGTTQVSTQPVAPVPDETGLGYGPVPVRPLVLAPGAAQAAPAQAAPSGGGGGGSNEIDQAFKQAAAAETAKADVEAKAAQAQTIALQEIQKQKEERVAATQKQLADWNDKGQKLFQAAMDAKIDPSRFWNSKSTGGKISASIGLILGGIGSALTHQPNAALTVMQNAIDRDVDAQKANVGKMQNLVGLHMQQGHNILAAGEMARADLSDLAAGKLAMTASKYAGEAAQANAQAVIAKLRAGAVEARQRVASMGLDNALKAIQLKMIPYQMALTRQVMGQMGGQGQQPEYLPSRAPAPMGSDPSNPLKYMVEARKDAAERTVPGPNGRPFLAYDKTVADKVRPALSAAQVTKKLLDDLKAATEGSTGMPGTNAAAVYDKTRRQVAELWAQVNGQTSLSDTQFKNLEKILPSTWEGFWRSKDRFGPIENALHEKTASLYEQAGLDPRAFPIREKPVR